MFSVEIFSLIILIIFNGKSYYYFFMYTQYWRKNLRHTHIYRRRLIVKCRAFTADSQNTDWTRRNVSVLVVVFVCVSINFVRATILPATDRGLSEHMIKVRIFSHASYYQQQKPQQNDIKCRLWAKINEKIYVCVLNSWSFSSFWPHNN